MLSSLFLRVRFLSLSLFILPAAAETSNAIEDYERPQALKVILMTTTTTMLSPTTISSRCSGRGTTRPSSSSSSSFASKSSKPCWSSSSSLSLFNERNVGVGGVFHHHFRLRKRRQRETNSPLLRGVRRTTPPRIPTTLERILGRKGEKRRRKVILTTRIMRLLKVF